MKMMNVGHDNATQHENHFQITHETHTRPVRTTMCPEKKPHLTNMPRKNRGWGGRPVHSTDQDSTQPKPTRNACPPTQDLEYSNYLGCPKTEMLGPMELGRLPARPTGTHLIKIPTKPKQTPPPKPVPMPTSLLQHFFWWHLVSPLVGSKLAKLLTGVRVPCGSFLHSLVKGGARLVPRCPNGWHRHHHCLVGV